MKNFRGYLAGSKIISDTCEIILNEGWVVKKKNDKGNYEIFVY